MDEDVLASAIAASTAVITFWENCMVAGGELLDLDQTSSSHVGRNRGGTSSQASAKRTSAAAARGLAVRADAQSPRSALSPADSGG